MYFTKLMKTAVLRSWPIHSFCSE